MAKISSQLQGLHHHRHPQHPASSPEILHKCMHNLHRHRAVTHLSPRDTRYLLSAFRTKRVHYCQEQLAKTFSHLQGLHHHRHHHLHNHHQHHQMSTCGRYEMTSLCSALGLACKSLLGSWRRGCDEHLM